MKHSLEAALAAVAFIATRVACAPTPTALESPVSLVLQVGETASLEEVDLTLTFDEVTSDSRCPRDVLCVTAGEATVVFRARSEDREGTLTFKVPPDGSDSAEFGDFKITITALEPQTESDKTIDPTDYTAHVLVEPS